MRYCSCTKKVPDTSSNNILLSGISHMYGYDMFIDMKCLTCGAEHEKYNRSEYKAEIIDITDIKFSLRCLTFEHLYIRELLEEKEEKVSIKEIFNIMQAIYLQYNGYYYEYFDSYIFEDVRGAIITYVLNKPSKGIEWRLSIYDTSSIDDYIESVKKILSKSSDKDFSLKDYLLSEKWIDFSDESTVKYGPASTGMKYATPYSGLKPSLNKIYLEKKEFELVEKQVNQKIKNDLELMYRKILQYIEAKYKGDFKEVWNKMKDIYHSDTRKSLNELIETGNNSNKILLTGIKNVFKIELDFILEDLTYENYEKIISKVKEMKEHVEKTILD